LKHLTDIRSAKAADARPECVEKSRGFVPQKQAAVSTPSPKTEPSNQPTPPPDVRFVPQNSSLTESELEELQEIDEELAEIDMLLSACK
jgi:hypothetical protein